MIKKWFLASIVISFAFYSNSSSYYGSDPPSPIRKSTSNDEDGRQKFKTTKSRKFSSRDSSFISPHIKADETYENYYEEDYPYSQSPAGDDRGRDVVSSYTKDVASKVLVALSAAAMSAIITHFLSLMVFSYSSAIVLTLVAIAATIYTFVESDVGDLCRSLGVFSILMISRARFQTFLTKLISQMKGAMMIGERRNFPPFTDNPWKYSPLEGEADLQFKMINVLLSLVLSGAYLGWKIAKQIPFFPGWIGAIAGASSLGYAGTFRDGRGDMLRFVGHSLQATLRELSVAAEDVHLRDTVSVVLAQVLSLWRALDEKFAIVEKLQALLVELVKLVKMVVGSYRGGFADGGGGGDGGMRRQQSAAGVRYGRGAYDGDHISETAGGGVNAGGLGGDSRIKMPSYPQVDEDEYGSESVPYEGTVGSRSSNRKYRQKDNRSNR